MTQADGEPVGEPDARDRHVRLLTKEEDVTDYHGQFTGTVTPRRR